MHNIEIGPLYVTFMRTVRVKEVDTSNLPPGLGIMEIYKVSDYEKVCPDSWDKKAYFISIHETEAMWMNFQCCTPVALLISAGGINAISGEKFENKLIEDNYVVTPPQPWLDGWKSADGSVYQFVSITAGDGKSVGEQLINTQDHAMQLSVYEAKNPEKLQSVRRPHTTWGISADDDCNYKCDPNACYSFGGASEMAIGKGGKIIQKIYEDPHGIKEWKENPTKTVKVYLINAAQFAEITKTEMPSKPVSTEDYNGKWFGLEDECLSDIHGTQIFDNLKSVEK
jgi:hypothetical protein